MRAGLSGGFMVRRQAALARIAACMALFAGSALSAQSIQPIIVEYTQKAAGRFEVTNNTLTPMAVVLEPKSFTIGRDGKATYRALDPNIHLELSEMSFRVEPQQTHYVFYKANAAALPAWFTVYAVFSPIQNDQGLKVRIMLPHTVYLYQKKPIDKEAISIEKAEYDAGRGVVDCDVENTSSSLVRVQEVSAVAGKSSSPGAGFPLLPHGARHIEVDWKETTPPSYLLFHFPHFDIRQPLSIKGQ